MNKILLVDDDKEMLQLYKMVLEDKFTVLTAQSGEQALALVKEDRPDLILLDVMMSNMNGIEVLEHLKNDASTSEIAVAMFTNLSDENYKNSAIEKGAIKYLIKSDYEPDDLLKEIESMFST